MKFASQNETLGTKETDAFQQNVHLLMGFMRRAAMVGKNALLCRHDPRRQELLVIQQKLAGTHALRHGKGCVLVFRLEDAYFLDRKVWSW